MVTYWGILFKINISMQNRLSIKFLKSNSVLTVYSHNPKKKHDYRVHLTLIILLTFSIKSKQVSRPSTDSFEFTYKSDRKNFVVKMKFLLFILLIIVAIVSITLGQDSESFAQDPGLFFSP